jgi:DNA polymerase-3 subunit delta
MHKARIAVDAGDSIDAALGGFVPPVHFRRKPLVESAVRSWSAERLARAMEQLADATLEARKLRTPVDGLVEPTAQRALLSIAQQARRAPK